MTEDEKGKSLHDRACRGETLTEEERQFMDRWYAKMDLEESLALGFPNRISIPLPYINEAFIKALREKCPGNIRLDIQLVDLNDAPSFTEEDFWSIIDRVIPDEDAGEEALEAAVLTLSEHPVSHIYLKTGWRKSSFCSTRKPTPGRHFPTALFQPMAFYMPARQWSPAANRVMKPF